MRAVIAVSEVPETNLAATETWLESAVSGERTSLDHMEVFPSLSRARTREILAYVTCWDEHPGTRLEENDTLIQVDDCLGDTDQVGRTWSITIRDL